MKYILRLKSEENIYDINLAKMENKKLSTNYYEDAFVNYDKAYFCSTKHEGLNLTYIEPGVYQIFIEIKMRWTGEVCELPLTINNTIKSVINNLKKEIFSISPEIIQGLFWKEDNIYYSKKRIL